MVDTGNSVRKIPAPELQTSAWLNTPQPLTLAALRGKVVVLHTFQIFCPGCVQVGIPQAQRIYQEFDPERVAVIGLHTVFEHHPVMGPDALEVFVHEYRLRFPIGIDQYVHADVIINCIGSESRFDQLDSRLVKNLMESGMIRCDDLRFGLDATPDGHLMGTDGQPSDLLYTLGTALKGVLWESTAIPEIRVQARDLAQKLISE